MMNVSPKIGFALSLLIVAGCGRPRPTDHVAVGQDIVLTKADGGVVEGKVASLDDKTVHLTTGQTTKAIPKDQIVDAAIVEGGAPVALPSTAKFREYTVPAGTRLALTLATAVNSETSQVNEAVDAHLAEPVSVGDAEVLPAGSTLRGTVSAVQSSGRIKGRAALALHFSSVAAAGRHDRYSIDATYSETAKATKREDATTIGIGAGAGAIIGALLGGKSGAAKGAAVGGGAGTAAVLSTKGDEVERSAGDRLTVTLRKSVDVRVPLH